MATLKFTFSADPFSRPQVERGIKTYCFENGLTCDITDLGGFWCKGRGVRIEGSDDAVVRAGDVLEGWLRRIATE